MSDLKKMMEKIEAMTGAFMPRLVIEELRSQGQHITADLVEGMADRIDYLEKKLALRPRRRGSVGRNPRKRE